MSVNRTHGLIVQLVRASGRNSVVRILKFQPGQLSIATSKNPTMANFILYIYIYIYIFIYIHIYALYIYTFIHIYYSKIR